MNSIGKIHSLVREPEKYTQVLGEFDVCVVGGSTTGVFAAVRASRMGARTALIEKLNCFGGNATAGMVCAWHSIFDVDFEQQIIGGLSIEILERLKKRNALVEKPWDAIYTSRMEKISHYCFNTEELKIELDEIVLENKIIPFLHTVFAGPYVIDGCLKGIFVQNKSGRGVILARAFVDATGDGDLCVALGERSRKVKDQQPACTCALVLGTQDIQNITELIYAHRQKYNIPNIGWDTVFPNAPNVALWAKSNIYHDVSDAIELTKAELEGRRQNRAMMDIVRKYGADGDKLVLLSLASTVAARETRHICCRYTLVGDDVLYGSTFPDAIANGAYPSDIHHNAQKLGATYRYLDGLEEYEQYGLQTQQSYWYRPGKSYRKYWQIPFRALIPASGKYENLLVCGRAIDADKEAFGAVRVMINMNQTGEAAGVAAAMIANSGKKVTDLDTNKLRENLKRGGSIIL